MSIADLIMPERITGIYALLIRRYLNPPAEQNEGDDVLA